MRRARTSVVPSRDFNLPDSVNDIDRIDAKDVTEELLRDYDRRSLPFIITNGTSYWPAMQKWAEKALLERYGDLKVGCESIPNITIQ